MRWLIGVVMAGFVLTTGAWTGVSEKVRQADAGKINLNKATLQQLQTLKGIGPAKAKAIVQYRQQHGDIARLTQLLMVKGIGPKLLSQLLQKVMILRPTHKNRCPVQAGTCQQHSKSFATGASR